MTLGEEDFEFAEGESILTECSYKYTIEEFARMAADFSLESAWTDPANRFAVLLLRVRETGHGEHKNE